MVEARVDVIIQLLSFHNIDLQRRGIYRLFVCIQQPSSTDEIIYATPLAVTQYKSSEVSEQFKPGLSGCYYFTQAFPIKYSEEQVKLNELLQFRAQGNFTRSSKATIKFELMFHNTDNLETIDSTSTLSSGELISTEKVTIHDLLEGIIEQTIVSFGGRNPCAITVNVFSLITSVKVASSRVLANILFQDSKGTPRKLVGAEEANETQELYVGTMSKMYHKLYEFLSLLKKKLRSENSPANITRMSTFVGSGGTSLFSERLASHLPQKIVEELVSELAIWTSRLVYLKEELLGAFDQEPRKLVNELRRRFDVKVRNYVDSLILKNVSDLSVNDLYRPKSRTSQRIEFVREQRRALALRDIEAGEGLTSGYTKQLKDSAIVFVDEYIKRGVSVETESIRPSRHLVVFVHGFKGRPSDMNALKGALIVYLPRIQTYCSESNVDHTDDDIGLQGERLADEVLTFIAKSNIGHKIKRISFVGHSMGGLMIRAALPFLSEFRSQMHFFITFNTPHIGFVEQQAAFIDTGIWLANIFQTSTSLYQISMQDTKVLENIFLYKLSDYEGLEWFKHVFLVGSHQDSFTPVESALVELPETVSTPVFAAMAQSILSRINHLYRLDVSYKLNPGLMDQLTGRAAHVEAIMEEHLMRTVIHSFAEVLL
mmetsp:Transcript_19103/g.34753  ORF Transcript_19103/g.34753 Transcript_19103/m.34753 type:complete len:656 (-) Transcript_19103:492-2459(-)